MVTWHMEKATHLAQMFSSMAVGVSLMSVVVSEKEGSRTGVWMWYLAEI